MILLGLGECAHAEAGVIRTGTGLLLLRIVDPEFETPVAIEIGLMNVIVLPIIVGTMVLVNAPVWWHWSVGLTILVIGAVGIVCLGVIRWLKLWGSRQF